MFWLYFFVSLLALIGALLLVGVRRALDPRRLIGWYLLILAITYLVRPIPVDVHVNSEIYTLLGGRGFLTVVMDMTIAVSLSLLSVGVGYRIASNASLVRTNAEPNLEARKGLLAACVILLAWGYVSAILFSDQAGVVNLEDRRFGVNTGRTAWLTDSIHFISTGSVALYLLTGNLLLSVAVAVPWFLIRVATGFSRIHLIGYFMALIPALLIRWKRQFVFRYFAQVGLVAVGILFTVLVFFPAVGSVRSEGRGFSDLSSQDFITALRQTMDPEKGTSRDIAGFEPTAYLFEVAHPPTWGTYYVYLYFIKPIPRTLWQGKPLPPDLAEWVAGVEEDERLFGLALGAIGDAFFAWGWFGIPFEFMLTGWAFRRLEYQAVDNKPTLTMLLAYAGFFSLLPQLGRDSLIHMIAERWLFLYGLPVSLFWFLSRSRQVVSSRPRPSGLRRA